MLCKHARSRAMRACARAVLSCVVQAYCTRTLAPHAPRSNAHARTTRARLHRTHTLAPRANAHACTARERLHRTRTRTLSPHAHAHACTSAKACSCTRKRFLVQKYACARARACLRARTRMLAHACDGGVIGCLSMLTRMYRTGCLQHYSKKI